MSGLESFLNVIIPLGIFIFFLYLIRAPLTNLFLWLQGLFFKGKDMAVEEGEVTVWDREVDFK